MFNLCLLVLLLAGTVVVSAQDTAMNPEAFVQSLSFQGNDQITDSRLARASDLRVFRPFSQDILEKSLVELRNFYTLNGFPAPRFNPEVDGPDTHGKVRVKIMVTELSLPRAESLEYRISGYPSPWWRLRLKSRFGWFIWQARRHGINLESLKKLARKEERGLRETGYRNARIDIHQEPGSHEHSPRILVEIMVDKPVRIRFDNVGFLTRRDIVHNWKRKHRTMNEKELNRLVKSTRDRLRKEGWLDAEVHSEITDGDRAITARIHADKGMRRYIESLYLTGRSGLETDDLGSVTGLHSPRLFGLWKTRPGPDQLQDGEKALKTHLENQGYTRPQCRIEMEESQDPGVRIHVDAEAGAGRTVGEVDFEGSQGISTDELTRVAGLQAGQPFVRRQLKDIMTRLTKRYWEAGYADVTMQARTRRTGSVIDVTFVIDEGPEYLQGPLILNGNYKTRSSLIYRLKRIAQGDPFNLERLGELQEAMYRTGVFESVSIRTEKHPEQSPPYQTAVLDIVERSTGFFETGVDFNTDRGLEWVIETGERNLLGQALDGKISGILGQERWLAAISLGRPLIFGFPLENRVRVGISHDRTNPGYTLRTYEAELRTIRQWDNDISLNLTYGYEREDVRDLDLDVAGEIDIQDTRSASLTPIMTVDRRDDPFRTTRGWFYQTRLKGSFDELGSDAEFIRWDHDLRLFYPLSEGVVLGGAVRLGRGWTLGDSVMPAGERYFLGGAGTNRGFEHKECGPLSSDGSPLGGLSYVLANAELRMHLAGRFHGAIFVDAGNVFLDTPVSRYLRTSAGLGVRYETPIGPFRVDLGFNLEPENDEPDYVLQIAFGHAF